MAETLLNTEWLINNVAENLDTHVYQVRFSCYGKNFTSFYFSDYELDYNADGWTDYITAANVQNNHIYFQQQAYRLVTITGGDDVENETLIQWFKDNAIRVKDKNLLELPVNYSGNNHIKVQAVRSVSGEDIKRSFFSHLDYNKTITPAWLTFVSDDAFTLEMYDNYKSWDGTIEYSTDITTWTTWNATQIAAAQGEDDRYYLYLRGKDNSVISGQDGYYFIFSSSAEDFEVECLGNIDTLLDYDNINWGLLSYPSIYCFYRLFYGCPITTVPILPYKYIPDYCYMGMFEDCWKLTTIPEDFLPATDLSQYCYKDMFKNSTITKAPSLPARIAQQGCYDSMFFSCASLEELPTMQLEQLASNCCQGMFRGTGITIIPDNYLPVLTLAPYCYQSMFAYCSELTTLVNLPATRFAHSCYYQMFLGCTKLENIPRQLFNSNTQMSISGCFSMFANCTALTYAPKLLSTSLNSSCYADMFYGCTSLTQAPIDMLPALSLPASCYYEMFRGCTHLTDAPSLPATTLSWSNTYYGMFENCVSLINPPVLGRMTRVGSNSCARMFYGCSSLVSAPTLSATTLGQNCYGYMFQGCTSLSEPPALPAETLVSQCYQYMFRGCTSLQRMPVISATTLATYCCRYMFYGCTSLTNVSPLLARDAASNCYQYMFNGCVSLTNAPEMTLRAVAPYCCYAMFNGCSNLITTPELVATTLANSCYAYMFNGTKITTTPILNHVTTWDNYCYSFMFSNCTSLLAVSSGIGSVLTAPEGACYGMFNGCTNLINIPIITAEEASTMSFREMFNGCSIIKMSLTQSSIYSHIYKAPLRGRFSSTATDSFNDMFKNTGGSFTGTPTLTDGAISLFTWNQPI